MESLRLYLKFIGIAFRSRLQYRSDFAVGCISVVVLNWVNLAMTWVLIHRFQALQGWVFWEIVLLYSMWLLSHCIYSLFFWHITTIEDDILHGRFDQYLIRPCSPLLQFLGREVNYMGVADVLFGVAAFTLAYRNLGLDWSGGQWAFFAAALLSGTAIETSIAWLIGSLSFWLGRSNAIFFVTLRFNLLAQQYPMDIFGKGFRIFITGFLPVAFVNYYPLTALLGKANALGLPLLGFASPAVALCLAALGALVWRRGMVRYASSGN